MTESLLQVVAGTERSEEESFVVPPPSNPRGVAPPIGEVVYPDVRRPRLAHHRGLFYRWEGDRWVETETRAIRAELYPWLGQAVYMSERGLKPFDPTKTKVANVLEALEAVVHVSEHVEAPAWLQGEDRGDVVALANGLLKLSTRAMYPHTPAYFNLHALPYAYDPAARIPVRWHQFLDDLFGDDQESIEVLAEIIGYVLAGGTSLEKIFLLVGPKRAGKGTIVRVVVELLGHENVAAPTLSSLATNFGLQPLIGKPLAAISDARLGTRGDGLVAVERLLSISGEDSITIDRKYKDPWTGRLPTRFLVVTNEIPRFTDASGALASRFVVLTLNRSFYGRENPRLTDELLTELPGIFTWALDGLDRLIERGHFVQPAVSASMLRHLEDLSSPISAFVRDRCTVHMELSVGTDVLWAAWKAWCADEGASPGTKAIFVRNLRAAVPSATPTRPGPRDARRHEIKGLALHVEPTVPNTPDIPDARPRGSEMSEVSKTGAPTPDDHQARRLAGNVREAGI